MMRRLVAPRLLSVIGPVAILGVVIVAGIALLGAGPSAAAPTSTAASGGSMVAAPAGLGQLLFEQACASCHGADAKGTSAGRTLIGVGAATVDWWISTGRMPLAAPVTQAPRKPSPFTPDQRAAIVNYVTSLGPGGPDIPTVDLTQSSIQTGGELFRTNCAACHGAAGIGGALARGAYAPSLHRATPLQIAEAIRIGPDNMPVFDQRTLSDSQVNDVVAYVLYLRHPQDRGGAGLGHIGPVAEGFVGLLFGVAGLMLVVYWIGDRTGAET
jgi:ubiquinol-cytochrome c reductase cytochrome c subunit